MAAVNDIYEYVPICWDDVNSQVGVSVLHYKVTAIQGQSCSDQDMVNILDGLFAPLYKPALSAQVEYIGSRLRKIAPIVPLAPVTTIVNRGAGTAVGDTMSRQTCGLIAKKTGFGGRAFRGRLYLPFPCEVDNTPEGKPSVNYINRASAIAVEMLRTQTLQFNVGDSTTLSPVLWHRATQSSTPIVAAAIRSSWATQRRRGDFGGLNPAPQASFGMLSVLTANSTPADIQRHVDETVAASRSAMRLRPGEVR